MRFAIFSFIFIFGILSFAPNMQGGQFFKISEVVEHYQTHQDSDETFSSFFSFVKDHYFSNHRTNENERHMPFKTTAVSAFILVIHHIELQPIHDSLFILDEDKACFGEPNHTIRNKEISIWNPPQLS
jgi:hypothetical protein